MSYILLRYLHLISVLVLAGAVIIENVAIKPVISGEDARNLAKVDAVYGISAALVLVLGLCLWLWVGKPSQFYSLNPLFQAKLGLFIGVALLSIYPTVFLLRQRRAAPADTSEIPVPPLVLTLIRLELAVLIFIPGLAFLVARGVGLNL